MRSDESRGLENKRGLMATPCVDLNFTGNPEIEVGVSQHKVRVPGEASELINIELVFYFVQVFSSFSRDNDQRQLSYCLGVSLG